MRPQKRAVRPEEQGRAVQRSAVALDYAGCQEQLGGSCGTAKALSFRASYGDRSLEVSAEVVASLRRASAKKDVEVSALRVSADEALRQHRDASAEPSCLGNKGLRFGQGRVCVKCDGAGLEHATRNSRHSTLPFGVATGNLTIRIRAWSASSRNATELFYAHGRWCEAARASEPPTRIKAPHVACAGCGVPNPCSADVWSISHEFRAGLSADRRSVLQPPVFPQRVDAALNLERRALADILLEHLAV